MDVVLVVLLAPEHPGECLAHHQRLVGVQPLRDDGCVERVGLLAAGAQDAVERPAELPACPPAVRRQPHANRTALAGRKLEHMVRRRLRPDVLRVDRRLVALDDEVVDPVLDVRRRVGRPEQALVVRLVLAEQQRGGGIGSQQPLADLGVRGPHAGRILRHRRLEGLVAPRPRVAEPERRQQMQRGRLRAAVDGGDQHEDVVLGGLRVLHGHVEVAVLVEDARVDQLVLEVLLAAALVLRHKVAVRELPLRVLVVALEVGVRGRAVEVEPVLLDVLAVVALAVGQAEHPLLEDRVGAVPERERETQPLALVADAGDPVLAPAVGARARLVVREVVPRVAAGAVVLAHGAPLALAEVGPPGLPRNRAGTRLLQARVFRRSDRGGHAPGVSAPAADRATPCEARRCPLHGRATWGSLERRAADGG
jgi:hypothetical protein